LENVPCKEFIPPAVFTPGLAWTIDAGRLAGLDPFPEGRVSSWRDNLLAAHQGRDSFVQIVQQNLGRYVVDRQTMSKQHKQI
jgi:hypothetical protein